MNVSNPAVLSHSLAAANMPNIPNAFAFYSNFGINRFSFPCCQLPSLMTTVDVIKRHKSRQMFTEEEDRLLLYLISIYGENQWGLVAKSMGNRNIRQCRDRYKNYLSKKNDIIHWTREEDKLLLEKEKDFGNRWSVITSFFANRSEMELKIRFDFLKQHLYSDSNQYVKNLKRSNTALTSSITQETSSDIEFNLDDLQEDIDLSFDINGIEDDSYDWLFE